MEGVKWVVDPKELETLPQPKEVSRAMLTAPDFNVDQFLLSISDFRTLRDVDEVVTLWETRLHSDLSNTVNDNFADFVKSALSVKSGIAPLAGVHADATKYAEKMASQQQALAEASAELEKELEEHKRICKEEADVKKLLYMLDLQNDIEAAMPECDLNDHETLVSLARMYVAMASIAHEMRAVKLVQVNLVSMITIGNELRGILNTAAAGTSDPQARLKLLEALQFVREVDLKQE